MQDDILRLQKLLREGTCCAAALVQLALAHKGQENPQLVQAMRGLCGGIQSGLVCGALTGAACAMNVLDPQRANALMVPELAEWFVQAMTDQYGGAACEDIVGGDPYAKAARCPALVEATYVQMKAVMESHGYAFSPTSPAVLDYEDAHTSPREA